MMRLFIGAKTGCEEYLASLQQELKKFGNGNYTDRANLHMTLKFLGEAAPGMVSDIRKSMEKVQQDSISLTFEGLQIFGRDIVSAKVGGELAKLSALHQTLETVLEKIGFEKEERRFRPHITLARRFRPFGHFDLTQVSHKRVEFHVDEVILFESMREAGRLVYKPLYKHRL